MRDTSWIKKLRRMACLAGSSAGAVACNVAPCSARFGDRPGLMGREALLFTAGSSVELQQTNDADGRDAIIGDSAQIMAQPQPGIFQLAHARAALQLQIVLVHHAQARRTYRMAAAFQA